MADEQRFSDKNVDPGSTIIGTVSVVVVVVIVIVVVNGVASIVAVVVADVVIASLCQNLNGNFEAVLVPKIAKSLLCFEIGSKRFRGVVNAINHHKSFG